MSDLYEDRSVSERLTRGFRQLRDRAGSLFQHPQDAGNVMLQLRRILPAEGWLTQRMARLRARAHFAKKGHIARIQELQQSISKLPPQAKRKVARELSARYKELRIDQRIERLDKVVTGYELRVRNLTRQAQAYLANNDYQKLTEVLEMAQKFQKLCTKLFKLIERTEAKLLATAKGAARQARKVSHA